MKTQWLGVDPGTKNYAVVGLSRDGVPTFARMLQNTICSTAQANAPQRPAYRAAIRGVLQRLRPRGVTAESFTVRGFGSNNIEMIGLMLGALQEACDGFGVEEFLVMSSTWKREVKRSCGEDALDRAEALGKTLRVPPHVIDASLIATYGLRGGTIVGISYSEIERLVRGTAALLPEYQRLTLKRTTKSKVGKRIKR